MTASHDRHDLWIDRSWNAGAAGLLYWRSFRRSICCRTWSTRVSSPTFPWACWRRLRCSTAWGGGSRRGEPSLSSLKAERSLPLVYATWRPQPSSELPRRRGRHITLQTSALCNRTFTGTDVQQYLITFINNLSYFHRKRCEWYRNDKWQYSYINQQLLPI